MPRPFQYYWPRSARAAAVVLLLLLYACATWAQQLDVLLPPQPAPPPMKYIPDATRAKLSEARDAKARTRLSIAEADARITAAEQQTTAQQFDAAAAELGIYQAVVGDALTYLQQLGKNDGKMRDLCKLLEQALFQQSGRIEAMRRSTPPEYAGNVRAALNYTRNTRDAALNAFYGSTVLRPERLDRNRPALTDPTPTKPASTKPPAQPDRQQ